MPRSPIARLDLLQQLPKGRTSERVAGDFLPEMRLPLNQPSNISKFLNPKRPVMRDKHVNRLSQMRELEHLVLSQMKNTSYIGRIVRRDLEMSLLVVVFLVDTRDPRYSQSSNVDNPRIAKEIDVFGGPSAVIEFPEVIGGFVV